MKRKPDFSRMIWIEMTPTEANTVAGGLMALLLLDRDKGPILDSDRERLALAQAVERIDRQLAELQWPRRNKAPMPV